MTTISIVFGNATAGVLVPGMSFNIMQKDQAKVFLAGPPLVKMATGEESSDEEWWSQNACNLFEFLIFCK